MLFNLQGIILKTKDAQVKMISYLPNLKRETLKKCLHLQSCQPSSAKRNDRKAPSLNTFHIINFM